jgi:toxin ParE1/3/4
LQPTPTDVRPSIAPSSFPAFAASTSRHSRDESREGPAANPVHVIFYRVMQPGAVEIVRVLHDRTEPRLHIGPSSIK